MKRFLSLFLLLTTALIAMAQEAYKQKDDHYFNQVVLQVTAPGTLEQAYYNASPSSIQGLKVEGPMNEADMRFIASLSAPGNLGSLHSINLHDAQLERIPDNCFKGQTYVTNFYFPATLKEIGSFAFAHVGSLQEITLPEGLERIGEQAFVGTVQTKNLVIPASVVQIGDGAFAHLKKAVSVSVAAGNPAFKVDNGLLIDLRTNRLLQCFVYRTGELDLPGTLESIGGLAFGTASKLTSIHIPASIKEIGEDAFAATYALASIEVETASEHFVSVDGVLFNKAQTTLICYPTSKHGTAYTVPATVRELATGAFQECGGGNAYKDIKKSSEKKKVALAHIRLPEGLEKIGKYAFTYTGVADINIPKTVREIGKECFYYSDIETIEVPEGVTRIEDGTFAYCYSLETLSLPSTLRHIGAKVFCMDDRMTTLNISAQTPPTLNDETFNLLGATLALHVPKGSKKAYERAAGWSDFSFDSIEDDLKVVTALQTVPQAQAEAVEVARYNLSGCRLSAPERGVNLVKMSDGRVKKVLVE